MLLELEPPVLLVPLAERDDVDACGLDRKAVV